MQGYSTLSRVQAAELSAPRLPPRAPQFAPVRTSTLRTRSQGSCAASKALPVQFFGFVF